MHPRTYSSLVSNGSGAVDCRVDAARRVPLQDRHGFEKHVNTLELRELPEEAEAVAPSTRHVLDTRAGHRQASVLLDNDPLGRDAPVDVAVAEKRAGCNEAIHKGKV
jgi:hypothetical protein